MNIVLIILAAGNATRFGENKQLYVLKNKKSILQNTILCFKRISAITSLIITTPHPTQEQFENEVSALALPFPFQCIPGGKTRFLSVKNAIDWVKQKNNPPTHVMIHDGARPFVDEILLNRLIKASQTHQGVVPGLPMVETIKQVINQQVIQTLNRDQVWRIQTPQLFDYQTFKSCFNQPISPNVTDDASIFEQLNLPIHVIKGDEKNIKITTKNDI